MNGVINDENKLASKQANYERDIKRKPSTIMLNIDRMFVENCVCVK